MMKSLTRLIGLSLTIILITASLFDPSLSETPSSHQAAPSEKSLSNPPQACCQTYSLKSPQYHHSIKFEDEYLRWQLQND